MLTNIKKTEKNHLKIPRSFRVCSAWGQRSFRVCSASDPHRRGFTLVELLVTISMFVIITGVVLVNSNQFDNSVLLHNFVYDVALTIKQAQSYGVNVRENSAAGFNSAYGVYFDIAHPTNFVLFNDTNADKKYDDVTSCPANDPSTECLQKYSMTKGTHIQSICAGAENSCGDAEQLSILFQRPSLAAKIYNISSDGSISAPQAYARIVLSSSGGATSTVVVTSVGQIYIK